MQVLVTGFEPFGDCQANPSEQVARALSGERVNDLEIVTAVLPVERLRGPERLLEAVRLYRPSAVLCLGLAAGRVSFGIERVAVNLLDFRIPDNAGEQAVDQPVVPGGPAAYFATLPVRAIQQAVRAAGVAADLSMSAGTYLCNQVMYTLLHYAAQEGLDLPGGFIHLPALPEHAALASGPMASMSLETMVRGTRAAVAALGSEAA